jgi:glycosyltransferase involved in cell wall biosynthesis
MGRVDVSGLVTAGEASVKKLLIIVNVDWFFLSHRLPIALAAKEAGYEVHIATGLTQPIETLEQYGFVVHPLNLSRGSQRISEVFSLFSAIRRLIQTLKPDVVHLVTIKPVLIGGVAARLAKVPKVVAAISGLGYVFTAHGLFAGIRRSLIGALYRLALSHQRAIAIVQNQDDGCVLRQITGLSTSQCVLIRGSGVDLDQWAWQPLPSGKPIVMMASRLLRDKGVQEFIDAARLLKHTDLATFVLVGSLDPENPSSLSQHDLDTWTSEGVVEVWGHRSEMRSTLSRATIVVLPSYREGLPKVLIEASALGRPCVTTDVPGCRDAIDDGSTGRLVKPRDARDLANVLRQLLEDPISLQCMAKETRLFAEENFSLAEVVQTHLEIYQN